MPQLDYDSSRPASRVRGFLVSRFSRGHLWIAGLLWLGFTGLTLSAVANGLDHAREKPITVAAATAGTLLGPMTGAISRDFQGCCLRASLSLLPWSGGALAVAILVQFLVPRGGTWTQLLRLSAWATGLLTWFGGGIISLLHALS